SVDEGGTLSVQLTHSYRMDAANPKGAAILSAARAVQQGQLANDEIVTRPKKLRHAGFEQLASEDTPSRRRFIDHWVDRHLRTRSLQRLARRILLHRDGQFRAEDIKILHALVAALNRFRLLTVTRTAALPTGADALNAAVHERLTEPSQTAAAAFFPGEPVMMLRNDYDRGLFNGDIGVLMMVAVGTQAALPMAVFPTSDGFEPFPLSVLQHDLTLAHAMTVHKAQGSEFDEVALVLPETDVPILTREIIYTGLTRARTSVVLVGAPALTRRAIARPVVRHCGLAEGLAAFAEGQTS
ncbi:MAG: ATP-binding domain-containing protein, partial [Myxococcota bacterium]